MKCLRSFEVERPGNPPVPPAPPGRGLFRSACPESPKPDNHPRRTLAGRLGAVLLVCTGHLPCQASLLTPADFVVPDLETAELRIPGEDLPLSKPGQELGDWVLSRADHEAAREELADLGLALEGERYGEALEILRTRPLSVFEEIERRLWEARILIEMERFPEANAILQRLRAAGQSSEPRLELLQILARVESGGTAAGEWDETLLSKRFPLDPWLIRIFAGSRGTPRSELFLAPLRDADDAGAPSPVLCDAAAHLFGQGDFAPAQEMAQRALAVDPLEARGHFLMGSSLLADRNFGSARKALLRAIRLRPDHPESFTNLATALHRLGRKEESLLMLILALENRIDSAEAWHNYLILLARELLPANTLRDLPHPPKEPVSSPARWHWQSAVSAIEEGDAEASIGHFLRSLSLDLNDPNTHNDFAVFLIEAGRKPLALPFLRAAAFLSPDSKLVEGNLDSLVVEVRELALRSAIAELEKKVSLRDQVAERISLAGLLEQSGREEEAIEQWRIVLDSDPDSIDHRLSLSRVLSRAGRFSEALSNMRPVLEVDPENPEWLFRAAWLLLQLPEPTGAERDEAVELASLACELTGNRNRDCLELLARALSAQGREREAEALRKRLREWDEAAGKPE